MIDLNFKFSTPPYGDFLISRIPSKRLSVKLQNLGYTTTDVSGIHIYTHGFSAPHKINDGWTLFSGLANVEGTLITGPASIQREVNTFTGAGISIRRIGETVEVWSDFMGLCSTFRSKDYVSNRTHLLAIALECHNRFRGDIEAITSNFWRANSFCGQISTFKTVIDGVELNPTNSRCKITKNSINIATNRYEHTAISPDEYQELIKRGAEEVSSNISAGIDSSAFDIVRLGITGGRDSRAILAALVRNGQIGKVRFFTSERGSDVPIATGLVKHFGGKYGPAGEIVDYEVYNHEETINRRKSSYFGLYNDPRFRLFNNIRTIRNGKELELSGGCGEVYRHFYQNNPFSSSNLSGKYNRSEFYNDEIMSKGQWHSLFAKGNFIPFADIMADTFDRLPGSTLGEKLNAHYQQFRNSMHFGLVASSMSSGKSVWHPLASPSLLQAANGLPQEVRGTGRVLFDLTRELCPELAYFKYTFGRPEYHTVPFHSPHQYDHNPPESPPAAPEIRILNNRAAIPRPAVKRFNENKYVKDSLTKLLTDIEETNLSFLSTSAVKSKLRWLSQSGRQPSLNRWLVKYEWAAILSRTC